MAILKIITAPDQRLKRISEPVDVVDDNIRKLMKDLEETAIHAGNSLGMAAPQLGVLKRVIYIDISKYDEVKRPKGFYPLYMANPKFIELSQEKIPEEEACFSVPGLGIEVQRHRKVKVEFLDYNNQLQVIEAEDFLARVLQHEIDHLNGVLTLDYLTPIRKDVAVRKLTKAKRIQG
jgi:peptide deformylase